MNSLPNAHARSTPTTLRFKHSRRRSGISLVLTSYMTDLFPLSSSIRYAASAREGRVLGIGCSPELADALRRLDRLERQDRLDLRQRNLQLTQRRDQACLPQLAGLVEAVARVLINPCRRQQTQLVIEPQRLGGQPRASGELSDAHLIHLLVPHRHDSCPTSLRLPPMSRSSRRVEEKRTPSYYFRSASGCWFATRAGTTRLWARGWVCPTGGRDVGPGVVAACERYGSLVAASVCLVTAADTGWVLSGRWRRSLGRARR